MKADNSKSKQQRKPRFRRSGPVNLVLQERDLEILKLVHRLRFASSEHIIALIPGSRKGILNRLYLLFHGQYLDRPPEQVKPFTVGSSPIVYGLGNRGADVLHMHCGIPRSKVDWTSKNRTAGAMFIDHTLLVSNFRVCLELAVRQHGGIRIIDAEEIINDQSGLEVNSSRMINGNVHYLKYTIIPDLIFGLNFLDEEEGQNRAFFMVEADRSTMPVMRNNLYQTSIFRKQVGYFDCWRKGQFKKTFGFQNARILFLTISEERTESMIQACKCVDDKGEGSKIFLFTEADNFSVHSIKNVFAPIWRNGRDDQMICLLD